jgi:acyl-CoA synthetase (AMP-forming)/AMP-acid ligase II
MRGIITSSSRLVKLLDALDGASGLSFAVVIDENSGLELSIPVYFFGDLCREHCTTRRDCSISKDLAAILYTSGSTGKPKGVMLAHAHIMAGASIVSTYLNITREDRTLAVLPFSFDAGLNQIMTAFQQGATLVMMSFVFGREIVKKLEQENISGLAGVPTLWSLLAQPHSDLQQTRLPRLRYITNTGGAMPQSVLAELRQSLPGTRIYLMYGLTEAFRSTYLPPEELDRRPTSIGRAIPDTEILVVNDHGRPCQPGVVGELVHRGPTVSLGYWGHPDLTDQVLRPHPFAVSQLRDGEKVCYSGDLAKMDEEGFLYFVGRRDAMIKSSGFRISPTEVEEAIFQSGMVSGAAVIGVPDEVLGQFIKAFVVPRSSDLYDPDMIITFCASKVPAYMVPREVEFLDELPKTSSGKVDYPALRKRSGLQ